MSDDLLAPDVPPEPDEDDERVVDADERRSGEGKEPTPGQLGLTPPD